MWCCISTPNFIWIRPSTIDLSCHTNFQAACCQPCCIHFRTMTTHDMQLTLGALSSNFGLIWVQSYRDSVIFTFWLETAHSCQLLASFWADFSKWRHLSSKARKGTSLHRNTLFESQSVKIGPTVRPGRVPEKTKDSQKSHKCVIFLATEPM